MTIEELATQATARYKLDPARVERALEIALRPTNIYPDRKEAGSFSVRASSGGWYSVNLARHFCSCQDSRNGHTCKHRIAVYLFTQAKAQTYAAARRIPVEQMLQELGYS